jgi:hypothetical protein
MSIYFVQKFDLFLGIMPTIPHSSSDNGIILLFYKTVVVLPETPCSGECDLFLRAELQQMVIDKLRTIV